MSAKTTIGGFGSRNGRGRPMSASTLRRNPSRGRIGGQGGAVPAAV